MTESTDEQADQSETTPEPHWWQSWGTTLRYVIGSLAQAVPSALILWQAWVRR